MYNHSALKGRLTRAINSGDPDKIMNAVEFALVTWNESGNPWPDQWSRWRNALDDAYYKARREDTLTPDQYDRFVRLGDAFRW